LRCRWYTVVDQRFCRKNHFAYNSIEYRNSCYHCLFKTFLSLSVSTTHKSQNLSYYYYAGFEFWQSPLCHHIQNGPCPMSADGTSGMKRAELKPLLHVIRRCITCWELYHHGPYNFMTWFGTGANLPSENFPYYHVGEIAAVAQSV
jgi:hypothetical protein